MSESGRAPTSAPVPIGRLTARADFLAAQAGRKVGAKTFLLTARERAADEAGTARVGITVTRKVGTAVERNRIRRRLREALRRTVPLAGRPGFDYVVIARRDVLSAPFEGLLAEIDAALARLHAPKGSSRTRNETTRP